MRDVLYSQLKNRLGEMSEGFRKHAELDIQVLRDAGVKIYEYLLQRSFGEGENQKLRIVAIWALSLVGDDSAVPSMLVCLRDKAKRGQTLYTLIRV